jgi:bifunctional ADP-heptose synthase (sugar kinase/adenylyltransferase)
MTKKDKIIITTGTFDPLSREELSFLKKCRSRGDWLIVGIHSDHWLLWTEFGFVQNYETRREIIQSLKIVDEIFLFDDSDGTVCQLLNIVKLCYPNADITYITENDMDNMPEKEIGGINFLNLK